MISFASLPGSSRVAPPLRPALLALALALVAGCAADRTPRAQVVLAATHTLEDCGLLDSLASAFRTAHPGHELRVLASATGEAIEQARAGDVDVLLTHAPEAELAAQARGDVVGRRALMHNTFVLAGPPDDPADVRAAVDAAGAFAAIAAADASFVSRDDGSGTHLQELATWRAAGVRPPRGAAYIRAGVGMADALRIADEREAYILTDPATLAVLGDALRLVPWIADDPALRNTYAVMRAARAPHPDAARLLADWLSSEEVRAIIARFGAGTPHGPQFRLLEE